MDDQLEKSPKLDESDYFDTDIELCKLIYRIPYYGKKISEEVCDGVDVEEELHPKFSKIVIIVITILIFLIILIIYFFFFEEPINKLTIGSWGDAFDIGDFYKPVRKGKYICYQPKHELVDLPTDFIHEYPVPPPPPPPTINYGPSLI